MRKQQPDYQEKQWKTKVDISKQNLKILSKTYQRAFFVTLDITQNFLICISTSQFHRFKKLGST